MNHRANIRPMITFSADTTLVSTKYTKQLCHADKQLWTSMTYSITTLQQSTTTAAAATNSACA